MYGEDVVIADVRTGQVAKVITLGEGEVRDSIVSRHEMYTANLEVGRAFCSIALSIISLQDS
jgi:hypothetical protein